jgi:heterodisulfide reductase subunit B
MNKYLYYPGCSMDGSGRAYGESLTAILELLGIELEEVRDWNCCGATEYASLHILPAYALVGRNLALAAQQRDGTRTLVAACAACYLNLSKISHYMSTDARMAQDINTALAAGDLHYTPGSLEVRHLLDVIYDEVGLAQIRSRVTRPLNGLRVAAYYGCQVTRPDYNHRWKNPEYPDQLEQLMKALGATVIDFPLKTHCCGGHMTQISEETAYELIRRLIYGAAQYEADIVVTLCPMCQLNLDAYQVEMNKHFKSNYRIPVVFFTQLMALAFGIEPVAAGFGREFISAGAALAKIGLEAPALAGPAPEPAHRRHKSEGLPMPKMPGGEEDAS